MPPQRPVVTVALVGPDGAGKTTISRLLESLPLPRPVRSIYMGVNLEASNLMLPTTRLVMSLKRSRGRTADMTMTVGPDTVPRHLPGLVARDARDALRLVLWVAEEWFRMAAALRLSRHGTIVVFDRYFLADYVTTTSSTSGTRRWPARVHEFLLLRAYPKPDLVVCLDAPGAVLHARKSGASAEWLEQRRMHYLRIADFVPHFAVVDATKPLDEVTRDVAGLITGLVEVQPA